MGNYKQPDICWKSNTARYTHFYKFLQEANGKFLIETVNEPMKRDVLLDLVPINKVGQARGNVDMRTMRQWSSGSCTEETSNE